MSKKIRAVPLLVLLLGCYLLTIGHCSVVTFFDDFTGSNYAPANPEKWVYVQDDPTSNISLYNNRLTVTGCDGFHDDYDIIKTKQTFQNIVSVSFNYSRSIETAGTFYCAQMNIQFNSTYLIFMGEWGVYSGGKVINDELYVGVQNASQILFFDIDLTYYYLNCLEKTVILMSLNQIGKNYFNFTMFYENATDTYPLIQDIQLYGNLTNFSTTVWFMTSKLSFTGGGTTSYDDLSIQCGGEVDYTAIIAIACIIVILILTSAIVFLVRRPGRSVQKIMRSLSYHLKKLQ